MRRDFYVGTRLDRGCIMWPTTNFTDNEIDVILRFLKELEDQVEDADVESICIVERPDK